MPVEVESCRLESDLPITPTGETVVISNAKSWLTAIKSFTTLFAMYLA